MRVHRIKKENLNKVSDELTKRGLTFEVCDPPLSVSDTESLDWEDNGFVKTSNTMLGVRCDLSGDKFHKLLVEIGVVSK